MINEVKSFEDRKQSLVELGKKKGCITYEELANELKGLDIDADSLDDLYNVLLERYNLAENNINVYQETIFKGDDN